MGYSAYGYAVLGVQLSKSDIMIDEPYRIGKHDYPPQVKFNPHTGKPLWGVCSVNIFDNDEGPPSDKNLPEDIGFVSEGPDSNVVYLGLVVKGKNGYFGQKGPVKVTPELLETIKTRLKAILQPTGLWKESAFGLYGVLQESY